MTVGRLQKRQQLGQLVQKSMQPLAREGSRYKPFPFYTKCEAHPLKLKPMQKLNPMQRLSQPAAQQAA